MSAVMEVEPLFLSAHEALIFAFNYADQQYAQSPMARIYREGGSGRGLVGVDGAGEAGMIMAEVMRLDQLERDALCVRFTKVRGTCHCCGHETDLPQVREALARLETYAIHETASTSSTALIRALVRSHFGLMNIGSARLTAEQHQVSQRTVEGHSGNVKRALRMLERRAERKVERLLKSSGKVASDD